MKFFEPMKGMIDNFHDLIYSKLEIQWYSTASLPQDRKREHKNKTNYIWSIFFGSYYSSTDHTKDRRDKEKLGKKEGNYCTL